MSSQDDGPILDLSSTRTRQRHGLLTSAFNSEDSAPAWESQDLRGKKRKRNESSSDDLLKDSFTVRPYPLTIPSKPCSLHPFILLPRAQLPLSCLEYAPSSNVLPRSRLYEAHVKILELEERMGSQLMVLIARHEDGRTFYAVEREDRGLYAVCQLGSWVDLGQLKAVAVAVRLDQVRTQETVIPKLHSKMPVETPAARKETAKKRLAIEALQSKVKRPVATLMTESQLSAAPVLQSQIQLSNNLLKESTTLEIATSQIDSQSLPPDSREVAVEDACQQLSADEHFDNVRNHYFEALYLSEASLAYFAKGSLSRARAAFHFDLDSSLDMKDHVAFLESIVLSSTQLDKKYRDGVSGCIADIDAGHSTSEALSNSTKPKKRKSSKKWKLAKTGLYSSEKALVSKWWLSTGREIESSGTGSSRNEVMRRRIAQLRNRETQLQVIVILEILALRPLLPTQNDNEEHLPTKGPGSVKDKPKLGKSKKPDLLEKLIDMHIDRLCIWQSTDMAVMGTVTNDAAQESRDQLQTPVPVDKQGNNDLRDFCIDVIIPFFYARLPDQCETINRRLGGPIVNAPPKARPPGSTAIAPSKPGAATKRAVPAKEPRTLTRQLTDERARERRSISRAPSRPASLSRSATAPMALAIKAESSDMQPLSLIPTIDSQNNRGGLLNSKKFARRQVDLTKIGSEVNHKIQKQAMIQAELKQAITTLKKPHRKLVGKEIVETAEKRSASKMRKSKKPVRNPLFQGTQIAATPKISRQKSMTEGSQQLEMPRIVEDVEESSIPTSSLPRIPQSVIQRSRSSTSNRNPLYQAVQATPSRRPASSGQARGGTLGPPAVDFGGLPPSSPIHVRRSSAQLFLSVPESAIKVSTKSDLHSVYEDTPVKKRKEMQIEHSHPFISRGKENALKSMRERGGMMQVLNPNNEDAVYRLWNDVDGMIDELA